MTPTIDPSIINEMPRDIVKDHTFYSDIVNNTEAFHLYYSMKENCTMECASIVRLGVYLNRESILN